MISSPVRPSDPPISLTNWSISSRVKFSKSPPLITLLTPEAVELLALLSRLLTGDTTVISDAQAEVAPGNALKKFGAKDIYACCTHAVLSGPAIERIKESSITKLIVLDTIKLPEEKKLDNIEVLTVADLFADAIKKIFNNESVSVLF